MLICNRSIGAYGVCSQRRSVSVVLKISNRMRSVDCTASMKQPAILVSSCTGKMGQSVGEAALRAGLELVPYTFCSTDDAKKMKSVKVGGKDVQLVPPGPERTALFLQLQKQYPLMIAVDYTVPDVIHDMVSMYLSNRIPFVMGTTGGDRERIAREVLASGVPAVIAPNMGKQIVAFQVRGDHCDDEAAKQWNSDPGDS